jgi:lipopolysaccharide transport system permease protein
MLDPDVRPSPDPRAGVGHPHGNGASAMTADTAAAGGEPPHLVVRPRAGWLPTAPGELWRYRELLRRFAARDVTLRYRQTALGVIWVVLQPLLGAGILSFVFGTVAGLEGPPGVGYFVFSLAGMVGWTAFSQTALRASGSLVSNAQLVSKVFFPRLLLPLATTLSTLVDVAVSLAVLVVLLVVQAVWAGPAILLMPLWLALLVGLGLGIGLVTSSLTVRYRDVQFVLPVAIQLLLFASPVAYSVSSAPESAQWAFAINPLTGLLEGLRWSLLGTEAPTAGAVVYSVAATVLALAMGLAIFSRLERQFADVI